MIWSNDPDFRTPSLPAVWLVATTARPANRVERSLLRRETARAVLARQNDFAAGDSEIDHLPSGQPILPARPELRLSLATRGGVVAIGLAPSPIGVDIEDVDPAGDIPVALLHPLERQALAALRGQDRAAIFALTWAAKEAYGKALGTGLLRAPESFAVSLSGGARFVVRDPERTGDTWGWTKLIENGGRIALAAAALVIDRS